MSVCRVAWQVESRLRSLVLCGAALRRLAAVFEAEVAAGLRQEPSSLQMENTYIPELPDGTGITIHQTTLSIVPGARHCSYSFAQLSFSISFRCHKSS